MMYYADHHGFPIVTFIDTPGAYADLKSEELGQVHEMFFYVSSVLVYLHHDIFYYFFLFICIIG